MVIMMIMVMNEQGRCWEGGAGRLSDYRSNGELGGGGGGGAILIANGVEVMLPTTESSSAESSPVRLL